MREPPLSPEPEERTFDWIEHAPPQRERAVMLSSEELAKLAAGHRIVEDLRERGLLLRKGEQGFALVLTLGILMALVALFVVTIESALSNESSARFSADNVAASHCAEAGISYALSLLDSPQGVGALNSGQESQLDTCVVDYRGRWDGEHWTIESAGHVGRAIAHVTATYPPLTYSRAPAPPIASAFRVILGVPLVCDPVDPPTGAYFDVAQRVAHFAGAYCRSWRKVPRDDGFGSIAAFVAAHEIGHGHDPQIGDRTDCSQRGACEGFADCYAAGHVVQVARLLGYSKRTALSFRRSAKTFGGQGSYGPIPASCWR